jgi:hypothetical protein
MQPLCRAPRMGIKAPSGGWAEARPSYRAFGDFVEDFGHLAEGLSAATEGKRQ